MSIQISFDHVPERLLGVPVVLQITPEFGPPILRPTVIETNEIVEVEAEAGDYALRIVLPHGEILSHAIRVHENEPAKARLNLGESHALDNLWISPSPLNFHRLSSSRMVASMSLTTAGDLDIFLGSKPANASRTPCRGGRFVSWSEEGEIVLIPRGDERLPKYPGEIRVEPEDSDNTREWHPTYCEVKLNQSPVLIVCPPSEHGLKVSIMPDPTPDYPGASPTLAFTRIGHPVADALFAYLRGGALESIRQSSTVVSDTLTEVLAQKVAGPVEATAAAYALYRADPSLHTDWVRNLADWFSHLSDGAVLYGWHLIRAGKSREAATYFDLALSRGIPMFTEGVRLLAAGYRYVEGLDLGHAENASRVATLITLVNPDSELTSLQLGTGQRIRWQSDS